MTVRLKKSPQQVSKTRKMDRDVEVSKGKKENWVTRSTETATQGEIKITEFCKTENTYKGARGAVQKAGNLNQGINKQDISLYTGEHRHQNK